MLVKGIRRLAFFLAPVLLVVSIVVTFYTNSQITLLVFGSELTDDAFSGSLKEGRSGALQDAFSLITSHEESDTSERQNEVFSISMRDKKYFPINFGEEKALNPSILPHPVLKDTWIIVAQQGRSESQQKSAFFSELVCDAKFIKGRLTCIKPPKSLPIAATSGDKCVGDLAYFSLNIGPHDARVFYGPKSPYIIYGSNSAYTCFGQWIQDFRMLVDWGAFETINTVNEYRMATELKRSAPFGSIEKNWFVFWDKEGQIYAHYDVSPKRVFARLEHDGSVGQDLAPLAAETDEKCMAKYMPSVDNPLESIHQATNSLSITLCQRSDLSCEPNDSNTYIFTIFQHKSYYSFHSVYEPYAMLFKRTPPFEIYGISSKPIWINGRKRAGEAPRPKGAEFEGLENWNQTEMFYVTSMNWKAQGQKYHGYVDDVLFIGFGIEDQRTAGIDVVVRELLIDLGLCSMV